MIIGMAKEGAIGKHSLASNKQTYSHIVTNSVFSEVTQRKMLQMES